jgi:pilus assembly protein CpaF
MSFGLSERIAGVAPATGGGLHDRIADGDAAAPADPYAELKTRVQAAALAGFGPKAFSGASDEARSERVLAIVTDLLERDPTPLAREERKALAQEIADDILGFGPLEPLLADASVSEIMVNNFDRIYVERRGRIEETHSAFLDEAHLLRIIDRIVSGVGRRIDESSPMVDARLPDGSRINAIIPPLSLCGPVLTIRKFARDTLGFDELVACGTLTREAAEFLRTCVRGKLNVLISGGTGVGKTTLLNALSSAIPGDERIITIEDAAELQLQQRHVIPLEARPPNAEGQGEVRIRDLVRNALRMRPDRVVVGEVRGAETLDMLQAMNTGHEGSLTTIHANTPRDALARLETLVLTAGVELPLRAVRDQIASAFDLVVQMTRLVDGTRRVTHVTEIAGMESEVVTLQDLFVAGVDGVEEGGLLAPLRATGLTPRFASKLAAHGAHLPLELLQVDEGRVAVLRTLRPTR